jgi:hypothetical protein
VQFFSLSVREANFVQLLDVLHIEDSKSFLKIVREFF